MPSDPTIRSAAEQYDAQATLHRIALAGDFSELDDLTDDQLRWCLRLTESPCRITLHIARLLADRGTK